MRKTTNDELGRLSAEEYAAAPKCPVAVVLDNVRSMNNVGSFFRTGAAFAVRRLCLCGITATPPSRDIHKTALGAELTVPWTYFADTADARDRGCVMLEGQRIDDVKGFYKLVGGRAGVTEYYMYDATNIRLRELAVSYALPQRLMRRTRVFSGMTVSLVARNLFFIYNAAPFDPDLVLSTGNDNQGIDVYGMPTVRSFGFNIKLEF